MREVVRQSLVWAALIAVLAGIVLGGIWVYDHAPKLIEVIAGLGIVVAFSVVLHSPGWLWAYIRETRKNREFAREQRTRELIRREIQRDRLR